MRLYLVRHGQAESLARSDSERRLTGTGVSQVRAMLAKFPDPALGGTGLVSPYRRARQTADELSRHFPSLQFLETSLLLPETSPQALCQGLLRYSDQTLVLVGHNPLLSKLLALLVANPTIVHMDTGTLACLQTDVVAPACAELEYFLQP